jgi:hypothetical protein
MIDHWTVLDSIEHAERETPFCACGQPMSPTAKSDGIWLECVSLAEGDRNRFGRLFSALGAYGHDRRHIVDSLAEAA